MNKGQIYSKIEGRQWSFELLPSDLFANADFNRITIYNPHLICAYFGQGADQTSVPLWEGLDFEFPDDTLIQPTTFTTSVLSSTQDPYNISYSTQYSYRTFSSQTQTKGNGGGALPQPPPPVAPTQLSKYSYTSYETNFYWFKSAQSFPQMNNYRRDKLADNTAYTNTIPVTGSISSNYNLYDTSVNSNFNFIDFLDSTSLPIERYFVRNETAGGTIYDGVVRQMDDVVLADWYLRFGFPSFYIGVMYIDRGNGFEFSYTIS